MFKKIKLLNKLKSIESRLCYLPDGLYDFKNRYIHDSDILKDYLKKFNYGDIFEINQEAIKVIKPDYNEMFKKRDCFSSKSFFSINYRQLTYDVMFNEIQKFQYNDNKNPYENYLEVVVIHMLSQSLTYGKSLLGGVWSSGAVFKKIKKRKNDSYRYFAENVQMKNDIMKSLRIKLSKYPDNYVFKADNYVLHEFDKSHSQNASLLEFRILQIQCKMILQEICLHSYYLSVEKKNNYNEKFNKCKRFIKTFPVKYNK